MKKKRYRNVTAKPGELKAQWGKLPNDTPDLVFAWGGSGASKGDSRLLYGLFCLPQYDYFGKQQSSFIDELKSRGYDLETLKFYIRKVAKK